MQRARQVAGAWRLGDAAKRLLAPAARGGGALLLLALLLGPPGLLAGCDDKGAPQLQAEASLPPLHLTDDTTDLLLTWIDARGAAHTCVTIAEVPEGSRAQVRVVTKDAGHGQLLYVADLSHKRGDGSYAVHTMARSEWEALLAQRREHHLAQHDPARPQPAPGRPPALPPGHPQAPGHPPAPRHPQAPGTPPPGTAPDAHPQAAPRGGVSAIIYGASWCKPCHQAAAYLERRGVHVVEHDIEKSSGKQREMQSKLQRAGRSGGSIPVIDIEGTILVGFSTRAIDRAIDKAVGRTRL